ncbi:MAG: hypothetical protein HBSAPP03_19720 [Phycisphaerae bacterium]|nr:MAG: hypothetical protein HBSAPP03_19720 [Phycisphaerae bacterium]
MVLRWITAAGMCVIALAGLLKLADYPAFMQSIASWRSLPAWLKAAGSVAVPIAEVGIAGCWLLGIRRDLCVVLGLVMLTIFSVAYAWEWFAHGTPHCGCMGVLTARVQFLDTAQAVLVRNGLLTGVFVAALLGRPRSHPWVHTRSPALMIGGKRGFTLPELLVAVALAGTLIALLLPSLSNVRRGGRETVSLSNLRQHAATLAAYAGEHRDLFPYLTDPNATWSVIRCESAGIVVTARYFEAAEVWWIGLADGYYNGNWRSPTFRSPLEPPEVTGGSYVLSCTTYALPEYFTSENRLDPPSQLRPVTLTSVLFPSAKGVLTDGSCDNADGGTYERDTARFMAALADGHAAAFDAARHLGPQLGPGDGPYLAYGAHWPWWVPMTHTYAGVRGRDVR